MHVFLDGQRVERRAYRSSNTSVTIRGVRIADDAMRPFEFADIQTTGLDTPVPNRPTRVVLNSEIMQMKVPNRTITV